MFFAFFLVTLLLALGVSAAVARAFSKPLDSILKRVIPDEISSAWLKYLKFAILVVGVSAGVRIHELEKYIASKDVKIADLTPERWILEFYRTIIETLQGIAWMLFVFFVLALIAYIVVRISELKRQHPNRPDS